MGDNVVVSNMELERLLSMKGGKGEASYANNSQAQVPSFAIFLSSLFVNLILDFHILLY